MDSQRPENPLRKYVRTRDNKDVAQLKEAGLQWTIASVANKLSYEIDWMGIPVIQTPEDLILMQELIFEVRPDVIIETGIAHGGGLVFYASLLELLQKGEAIGVDIEIREHNRKAIEAHPMFKRIEMVEGDSTSPGTVSEIRRKIPEGARVIVCLDSNHEKAHVLKEMETYRDFILPGGYLVVFDMVASELAALGVLDKDYDKYINNGPKEAVAEFLKKHDDFVIDKRFDKLYVTHNRGGYLKRVK